MYTFCMDPIAMQPCNIQAAPVIAPLIDHSFFASIQVHQNSDELAKNDHWVCRGSAGMMALKLHGVGRGGTTIKSSSLSLLP
jgi:hypothetical protein